MKIDASKSIREIVNEAPEYAVILRDFGFDLQGQAGWSLNSACQAVHVSVDDVVHSLEASAPTQKNNHIADWNESAPSLLIAHILEKHHSYCREELTRLEQLFGTVVRANIGRHPELRRMQAVFLKMGADLKQHLLKEEQTLFPMIVRLEEAHNRHAALPKFPFGTIANPIRMMILEHDTGGHELDEIRRLSSDYAPPPDGDHDYLALMEGLQRFEDDMKAHVFLENERLFPRAIALEQKNATSGSAHS